MPDNKEDPKTVPAAHDTGTEVSTSEDQYSTGPAESADTGKSKTYYLREGVDHYGVVKGERVHLSQEGDSIELTADQAKAFGDKFYTDAEWKGLSAERKARREAAAAESRVAAATAGSEQTSPEERQAEGNKGGKSNATGETGKPSTTSDKK